MAFFTADQLVAIVEKCVKDTLGVVSYHPVERERYMFGTRACEACVFRLEWFQGLKIVGLGGAISIKTRGYVLEQHFRDVALDKTQAPCILICDANGGVLSEIKGSDEMSLYNGLKAIISPVVAVSPPVVESNTLLDILRDFLKLLKLRK
jgi:hypothetical protein